MREHNYYLYITTNRARRPLYTGMTNDLLVRIGQHKEKNIEGFTKKYNLDRLVYFEHGTDVNAVIDREKQIKKWRREKKVI